MADRRSTVQTESRGMNSGKTSSSNNVTRDDAQATSGGTGPSSAIAATAAATMVPGRRPSQAFFRRLSMSMGTGRKSSMFPSSNQPLPNTYRIEPDDDYRFRPYKIQAKILEILVEELKGETYNPATVNELVKNVSRSVHQLMKNLQLPRYKIVMQTVITQKFDQLVRIESYDLILFVTILWRYEY
jgi:hypothetical protein